MWGDSPASPPATMVNSVCRPPPPPASAGAATHVTRWQTAAFCNQGGEIEQERPDLCACCSEADLCFIWMNWDSKFLDKSGKQNFV